MKLNEEIFKIFTNERFGKNDVSIYFKYKTLDSDENPGEYIFKNDEGIKKVLKNLDSSFGNSAKAKDSV